MKASCFEHKTRRNLCLHKAYIVDIVHSGGGYAQYIISGVLTTPMGREAVMVGIGTNISVTLLYSLEYYNVHDNIFELPNKNVMLRKRGETLKLCIGN